MNNDETKIGHDTTSQNCCFDRRWTLNEASCVSVRWVENARHMRRVIRRVWRMTRYVKR